MIDRCQETIPLFLVSATFQCSLQECVCQSQLSAADFNLYVSHWQTNTLDAVSCLHLHTAAMPACQSHTCYLHYRAAACPETQPICLKSITKHSVSSTWWNSLWTFRCDLELEEKFTVNQMRWGAECRVGSFPTGQ